MLELPWFFSIQQEKINNCFRRIRTALVNESPFKKSLDFHRRKSLKITHILKVFSTAF
jgi:hypothetical protein